MGKIIIILVIFIYKSIALASPIEIISPIEGSSYSLKCSNGYTLIDEVCVSNRSITASTPEELADAIKIYRIPELVKRKLQESLNSLSPKFQSLNGMPAFTTYVEKADNFTITLHNGGIVRIKARDRYKYSFPQHFPNSKKCILFKEIFDWYLVIQGYNYKYKHDFYQVDLLEIPATGPNYINTIKEFIELLEKNT